jgi:hypothetical protein
MRKLILIMLLGLTACTCKDYKYEIHGKVQTSITDSTQDAIWFTDTISFDGDTITYFNSNGLEVRIRPPYILIDKTLKK